MEYKTSEAQRKAQRKYAQKHKEYYNAKQKEYAQRLRIYKHRIDLALEYAEKSGYDISNGIIIDILNGEITQLDENLL